MKFNIPGSCLSLIIIFSSLFVGCATVRRSPDVLNVKQGNLINTNADEDLEDAASALAAVTGSISRKEMSQEELYQAARSLKDDPEAKQAIEAISSSFDQKDVRIKYSPATGKRYSADIEFDPETGVRLLPVQ